MVSKQHVKHITDEPHLSFPPGRQSEPQEDADSDHDYEIVDDSFSAVIKKAQENVIYY